MTAPTLADIEIVSGETPDDILWTFNASITGMVVRVGVGTAEGDTSLAQWHSDGASPALLIAANGLSVSISPTVVTSAVTAAWAARSYRYELWIKSGSTDHPYYYGSWRVRAGQRVAP